MTQESNYKTTKQLSDSSGYSIRTIQKWCQDEDLPSQKLGRDYVILESDWDMFLETYQPRRPSGNDD